MRARLRSKVSTTVLVCSSLIALTAYAHEGHHQDEEAKLTQSEESIREAEIKLIGATYLAKVKPIFQKACFDCHSNQPVYPWYYKIPGAKQLIDSDISESKEHLDFSNDYPFKGHGTPEEDLKAIVDVIRDGSMPPFRYRIFHLKQKVTEDEKSVVLKWATESAAILAEPTQKTRNHK